MKNLLAVLSFLIISLSGIGQTINPSLGTTSNKAYAPAQAVPTDFRTYYYDQTNFVMRAYQSTSEVLAYLNLAKYRTGQFPIVVNNGGTLSGGVITGGTNTLYYFKDGVADANLVIMIPSASTTCTGCLLAANNLSDLLNIPTALTNLGIGSMGLLGSTAAGDLTGTWPSITVTKFNGQLPSYYLNYNNLFNQPTIPAQLNAIAGSGMTITGTFPNLTFIAAGGFNTAGVFLKALSSSTIALDTQNYRKVDTLIGVNDSTLNFNINGRGYTVTLRGGVKGGGAGVGSVTNVSVVTANGVSAAVANPTSTPALTFTLGAITPSTVDGLTLTSIAVGFTIQGGTTSKTLTVPLDATVSGTNTGDLTVAGQTYGTLAGQVLTFAAVNLSGTNVTGTLAAARFPALTGDVTNSVGSLATTISANAVTNAKMATMANLTLKGNISGGVAVPSDLTGLQVNTMLPTFGLSTNGLVPFPTTSTGKVLSDAGTWIANGSGNTNTNVGGGYYIGIAGTNTLKTFLAGYAIIIDSVTANTLKFTADTTKLQTKGQDSIFVKNMPSGGTGISTLWVGGDTIYAKKPVAGANITITQNNDSTYTITGQAGGGSGITLIGALDSQSPSTNGATISGSSLYMQSADPTHAGLMNTVSQTIAGAKTYSAAPTFSTLTNTGGVLYTNSSGTVTQSAGGTARATLHGGSAPFYSFIDLVNDIDAATTLTINTGGTGTKTPALVAGTGISITGLWPNNTINNTTLGTVTNIAMSGGTTGLTFGGGPITVSGTFTAGGTLVVPNGGTGGSSWTPNAPILGGSTATGTFQQVSNGSEGQVLTYHTGSIPTWTTVSGGGGGTFIYLPDVAANTANYTVTTKNFIILTDLTGQANRNFVLPTSPTDGTPIVVRNENATVSTFAWTFTNGTVKDNIGNTITTMSNITTYQLVYSATRTTWYIIN